MDKNEQKWEKKRIREKLSIFAPQSKDPYHLLGKNGEEPEDESMLNIATVGNKRSDKDKRENDNDCYDETLRMEDTLSGRNRAGFDPIKFEQNKKKAPELICQASGDDFNDKPDDAIYVLEKPKYVGIAPGGKKETMKQFDNCNAETVTEFKVGYKFESMAAKISNTGKVHKEHRKYLVGRPRAQRGQTWDQDIEVFYFFEDSEAKQELRMQKEEEEKRLAALAKQQNSLKIESLIKNQPLTKVIEEEGNSDFDDENNQKSPDLIDTIGLQNGNYDIKESNPTNQTSETGRNLSLYKNSNSNHKEVDSKFQNQMVFSDENGYGGNNIIHEEDHVEDSNDERSMNIKKNPNGDVGVLRVVLPSKQIMETDEKTNQQTTRKSKLQDAEF